MGNCQPVLLVLTEVQLQHEAISKILSDTVVWFMWICGSESDVAAQLTSAVNPC